MNRPFWISIGVLSAILTTVACWLVMYFYFFSPIRVVERASGLKLPKGVELLWVQEEKDAFF